jgi:anti-sigma B factor antagonist
MKFDHYIQHGIVILAPQGRLTVENEAQLTAAIRRLHATGQFHIVLNLAGVPGIDSCGLGAIAQAYVSTWRRGGVMKLAEVGPRVQRLFQVTALETVMEVYPTVAEAIDSFGDRLIMEAAARPPGGMVAFGF